MQWEKLERLNEWWFSGAVSTELALPFKRDLFHVLVEFLEKRQILSITGLRRVGKSTTMYHLISLLLEKKVPSKNIFYFTFDEKTEDLDEAISLYEERKKVDLRNEQTYIFLDEVQKLDNWPNQLKKYYDLYPKLKFVISGSESLFISSTGKETLAGRIYEFPLKPLSFKEFVLLKENSLNLPGVKIKQLFREFILKGGFPEMANKSEEEAKMYVRSSVVDKIIYQDVVKLTGIRDTDLLKTLIELIAVNPGMALEYQSLAKQLGRDRKVIKTYVSILQDSFLIKTLGNYRKSSLATLRKTKKVYPTDTGVISAYKESIDDQSFGRMVETAVVNHFDSRFFWKNSHEVDLVTDRPIEVKYQNKIIDNDLLGLRACMGKFSFKNGLLLSKDHEEKISVSQGEISITPVFDFLLAEVSKGDVLEGVQNLKQATAKRGSGPA